MHCGKLKRGSAAVVALALIHPAAAEPSITAGPTPCVAAGQFPRVDVDIESAAEVSEARVVFRSDLSPSWYAVDLCAQDGTWTASLPAPDGDLRRLSYFITARDRTGASRFPKDGALTVEAQRACTPEQAAALGGPATLHLVGLATLDLAGFDKAGIRAFIEDPSKTAPPGGAMLGDFHTVLQDPLRVRVRALGASTGPLVGTLTAWDQHTLVIDVAGQKRPLVLDRGDVYGLEVSRHDGALRRRQAFAGAGLGLGAAVLAGLAAGAAWGGGGDVSSDFAFVGPATTLCLAPVLVGLGALWGASKPAEQWEAAPELAAPSPPRLSLAVRPARRGAAVFLQATF